ncbi:copper resistance protein NlpE N-terminal domain-containing protein [Salmonella enterica subsp. enterica]|nr:copper resistance protein NlpE N-terminal domain-containing protein [Salmonella enterica subsp. enterica]
MQQSWRGVLPCADCEGIETSLFLEKRRHMGDERAIRGAKEQPPLLRHTVLGGRINWWLTDSNGEMLLSRKAMRWRCSTEEGNQLRSNYTLVPVTASLPVAPMPWYVCIQGRCGDNTDVRPENGCRSPVTSASAAIWRQVKAEKPVLTVEGHFVLAAVGHGRAVKTLIADKNIEVCAG